MVLIYKVVSKYYKRIFIQRLCFGDYNNIVTFGHHKDQSCHVPDTNNGVSVVDVTAQ